MFSEVNFPFPAHWANINWNQNKSRLRPFYQRDINLSSKHIVTSRILYRWSKLLLLQSICQCIHRNFPLTISKTLKKVTKTKHVLLYPQERLLLVPSVSWNSRTLQHLPVQDFLCIHAGQVQQRAYMHFSIWAIGGKKKYKCKSVLKAWMKFNQTQQHGLNTLKIILHSHLTKVKVKCFTWDLPEVLKQADKRLFPSLSSAIYNILHHLFPFGMDKHQTNSFWRCSSLSTSSRIEPASTKDQVFKVS